MVIVLLQKDKFIGLCLQQLTCHGSLGFFLIRKNMAKYIDHYFAVFRQNYSHNINTSTIQNAHSVTYYSPWHTPNSITTQKTTVTISKRIAQVLA